MRAKSYSKHSPSRERDDRLRAGRAAAETLAVVSPGTTLVKVQLQFAPAMEPLHATQSFVLYPAAKAFFAYPCPYGDCDGLYDLAAEAARTLTTEKRHIAGTVECTGKRARDGLQRQSCGLRMSYTIIATRER